MKEKRVKEEDVEQTVRSSGHTILATRFAVDTVLSFSRTFSSGRVISSNFVPVIAVVSIGCTIEVIVNKSSR